MKRKQNIAKKAITLRLNAELVDEFKTLVRDEAGKPLFLTNALFVEDAIRAHLKTVRRRLMGRESDMGDLFSRNER